MDKHTESRGGGSPRRSATGALARRLAGIPLLGRFLGGDPLLRNGVVLTLASLASSVLGAAYWSVVGPGLHYSTGTVGRNYSAVSMVMFLGGVSQLNLADVMVRFAPSAGRNTRRIVIRAYLASIGLALLVGVGFVLIVPWVSPEIGRAHV